MKGSVRLTQKLVAFEHPTVTSQIGCGHNGELGINLSAVFDKLRREFVPKRGIEMSETDRMRVSMR